MKIKGFYVEKIVFDGFFFRRYALEPLMKICAANYDNTKDFYDDDDGNWDFVGNPFIIISIQIYKKESIQILSNQIKTEPKAQKKIAKHHHKSEPFSSQEF